MSASRTRQRRPYHHGDLRQALIEETVRLVEAEGLTALTLRKVARQVGVSHAAPAHHFKDLDGLLQAAAVFGHDALRAALQAGVARSTKRDGVSRLREAGLAYVEFAVEHAALFGLMFHPALGRRPWSPELERSAVAAFDVLLETIRLAQEQGAVRAANPRDLALAAWSALHGLAVLVTGGQAAHKGFRLESRRLAETVAAVLFEGLRAR